VIGVHRFNRLHRGNHEGVTSPSTSVEPALPLAVGPLSSAVLDVLSQRPVRRHLARIEAPVRDSDPYGQDLQMALYVCYELHYRGFAGVDPRWEWNPSLLHLRGLLEESFLSAVQRDVGEIGTDTSAAEAMEELSVEPVDGNGPSYYLRDAGTWQQMREYFVHRSLYHLKEGDPHAWAIPRLIGQAKASFVAVEFDEYGGGRGNHVHQQLYADLMDAAGLSSTYLGYIDYVGAEALASVNLMSMFGLHRELRGLLSGTSRRPRSPHRRVRADWSKRSSGWVRPRRARTSTANTWRPTPYMNRWCGPMS
jgi:hypothetical protein